MSIWIAIALLTAVWGLAPLPRDIRDENKQNTDIRNH